jgi:hypothetical protein
MTRSAPPDRGYGWPASVTGGAGAAGVKVAAGILGLVGAALVLVAGFVPYAKFATGGEGPAPLSLSIFNPPSAIAGFGWYMLEPIAAVLLGILGGALLLAVRRGRVPVAAAGMLIALGIQTLLLFATYAFAYSNSIYQMGPGGPVGMVAGVVLAIGGFIGLAGRAGQEPAQGTAGPAAGAGAAAPPYQAS